jgi:hypothetical protein
VYPDGYVSWSPSEIFEKAYTDVTESEFKPAVIEQRARSVVEDMAYGNRNMVAQADHSWRDRELRNECLRNAVGMVCSGNVPGGTDPVELARGFLAFVTEEPKSE